MEPTMSFHGVKTLEVTAQRHTTHRPDGGEPFWHGRVRLTDSEGATFSIPVFGADGKPIELKMPEETLAGASTDERLERYVNQLAALGSATVGLCNDGDMVGYSLIRAARSAIESARLLLRDALDVRVNSKRPPETCDPFAANEGPALDSPPAGENAHCPPGCKIDQAKYSGKYASEGE